jgi:hypothetical protein
VSVRQYHLFISSFQIQEFCTNWPDDARTGTGYVSEELQYEIDSDIVEDSEDSDKGHKGQKRKNDTNWKNDTKKIHRKKIQKTNERKDVKGKMKNSKRPRPSTVVHVDNSNDSDTSKRPRPSTVVHVDNSNDSDTSKRPRPSTVVHVDHSNDSDDSSDNTTLNKMVR